MTVKELLELENLNLKEINFIEIYKADESLRDADDSRARKFHSDYIESVNDEIESQVDNGVHNLTEKQLNMEVIEYELMDCYDYNNSVLANTQMTTDDYGYDGTEKILCILVYTKWYALVSEEYPDWETGTFSFEEAKQMLKDKGEEYSIDVVDYTDSFCLDTIHYEDLF